MQKAEEATNTGKTETSRSLLGLAQRALASASLTIGAALSGE
jgi:hypothetical protein